MFLEKISIKGFRIFENLELVLNPGLNVLVGENDSGKTSLIDAIRYVLGSNSADRVFISEKDFHNDADSFTIQLKFSNIELHAHRFVEHLSHEEFQDENGAITLKPVLYVQLSAQKTGVERRGFAYFKKEIRSGCDGNGLRLESEIQDFLATTYLKPLRDAEVELSSGRASRLSQILNSSKEIISKKDDILDTVAEANEKLLENKGPLKNSADKIRESYLHNLIFENDKDVYGVFIDIAGVRSKKLSSMSDTAKRRHLRAILESLNLELTEEGKLHGLGYHNILFMAAELLLLEQGGENEFPLLLIEEPEAHLHPQLQMKLLQFITKRVKSRDNPEGIQCLLTTNSPNLSSKADPSFVTLLGNGKVWPLRPGLTELEEEDYDFLRKFLDATKANVFFARGLLFVEGDSENILIPRLAELLGRPLENYGVSIIKYDNSHSWRRFAKLFLRKGQDDNPEAWMKTRICVLRDLDLWPDCAEKKDDYSNEYGFLKYEKGNKNYWIRNVNVEEHRKKLIGGLQRQNVRVKISDDWTFEYCLAKYGLFNECYESINDSQNGKEEIVGDGDNKATYIQREVRKTKTDFAYKLSRILDKKRDKMMHDELMNAEFNDSEDKEQIIDALKRKYAIELKSKLPKKIVEAIEYVTEPIVNDEDLERNEDV